MRINFSANTEIGQYNDTLILDENVSYTDAEIEQMKLNRVNKWVDYIKNANNEVAEDPLMDPNVFQGTYI